MMSEVEYVRREMALAISDSFVRFLLGDDALPERERPRFTMPELADILVDAEDRENAKKGL